MLVFSIVGLCMSKQNQWENVCNEETRKETDKKKERRSNGIKWEAALRKNWQQICGKY